MFDFFRKRAGLSVIALKMLTGDRAKYLGLVFGIMFATLLMAQQVSIFIGLMNRTASQISDVKEADIWVMDHRVSYIDEIEAIRDIDLYRVRGVEGVDWAVPLYKGNAVIRSKDATMNQVILMGVDDTTFVGAPPKMLVGKLEDLKQKNAVIIDKDGYKFIWPNEPFQINKIVEMNDKRVKIVGIAEVSPPFTTFPIVYAKYTDAIGFSAKTRNKMSFVVASVDNQYDPKAVAQKIEEKTGLQALTKYDFGWRSIKYYLTRTGIPVNFGITVALGFIVGAVIAAQTFYIFILENLKQFGALKAIGVTNKQILFMVLLQAVVVGAIGYGLGIGLTGVFFKLMDSSSALRGMRLLWQVMVGSGLAVFIIMIISSIFSIRKVFVLDPAVVFRG